MTRFKLFIENMLVYGLSGIISGLIPYIMLPIIAGVMPDASYMGIYDVSVSINSLLTTFSVFGMYDAMFRLFFDKEDDVYKKQVCSTALGIVAFIAIVVGGALFIGAEKIAYLLIGHAKYGYLLKICSFSIFLGAVNTILGAPARMENRKKLLLYVNAIIPSVAYVGAYCLLKCGLYESGMLIGGLCSVSISVLVYGVVNRKWFEIRKFNLEILKKLIKIAVPLMPTFLMYWIFNAADRLIISTVLGTAETGVYSVGAKISQISQLLYLAFAGGWQYFAFSTMKDSDQVEMTSSIFEFLEGMAFIFSIIVLAIIRWPYQMLFAEEYWEGIYIIPFLFVAPLLLMLYQTVSNQFLVIKKTIYGTVCLFIGVLVNLVLNFILIYKWGIVGVSVASFIGYIVSLIMALMILVHLKLFNIKRRMLGVALVELCYVFVWSYISDRLILSIIVSMFFVLLILVNYVKEIKMIYKKIIG